MVTLKQIYQKQRETQPTSYLFKLLDRTFTEYNNLFDDIGEELTKSIIRRYGFYVYDSYEEECDYELLTEFIDDYNAYININKNSIRMYIESLTNHYNPTENYDKNSTITFTKTGSESTQGGITRGGSTNTTENKVSPDNNELYYSSSLTTDTIGSSTDSNNSTLSFNDRTDTTTEHTHGNIGTTMGSQMISGEVSIRLKSLMEIIIINFIKERCW